MFQIPSLALRIKPRVWGWAVGQHTPRVGVGCPTRCQKKKKDSLTLLPQNHLDYFNNLLPDLRHRNSDNYQVHQAHLFTVTLTQGQKKKAMEWTTKKHKRWNPQQLPANSSDCSIR